MPMMTDRRPGGRIAAGLVVMLLLAASAQGRGDLPVQGASAGEPKAATAGRPPCCYTNPQYAGPCAVQPVKGETCASILAYLNNPRSEGKSYCSNTNIRGGWKRARCARGNREVGAGGVEPPRAARP
jgi:hypothetical protein